MPTETADEKDAFLKALMAELPAFAHHLSQWEIPQELRSARFGVTHYHHPELLAALDTLAPEQQLLEMVDKVIFPLVRNQMTPWIGTAADIQARLTDNNCECRIQAIKLLYTASMCGTYLSRLQNKHPDRVTSRRLQGHTEYTIAPPAISERGADTSV